MGNIIELTTEMEEVEAFPCRKAKNRLAHTRKINPKTLQQAIKKLPDAYLRKHAENFNASITLP
jgi:hypothetical protein